MPGAHKGQKNVLDSQNWGYRHVSARNQNSGILEEQSVLYHLAFSLALAIWFKLSLNIIIQDAVRDISQKRHSGKEVVTTVFQGRGVEKCRPQHARMWTGLSALGMKILPIA